MNEEEIRALDRRLAEAVGFYSEAWWSPDAFVRLLTWAVGNGFEVCIGAPSFFVIVTDETRLPDEWAHTYQSDGETVQLAFCIALDAALTARKERTT